MDVQDVAKVSAGRTRLVPILVLIVLAETFAIGIAVRQLSAHAAEALSQAQATAQLQAPALAAATDRDDGCAMDEAAMARLPQK